MTRIHELLVARGCPVSYQSVWGFLQRRQWRRPRRTTIRMEETPPGEVAEMDFGRLGLIHDPGSGRRRVVYGLVLVLGYSRHSFLWPTCNQKLEDIIAGLEAAWAFFGGISRYVVIDNCPPAVATADPLHPVFTHCFLEYSQRRGFIADAARSRHPKDKPKVERGVPYARERFFKGGDFQDRVLPVWGARISGSVSPAKGLSGELGPSRLVVRSNVVKRLSEPGIHAPAGIQDGPGQGAVAGSHLDHMEDGRVSEKAPHLLQLPCYQGAEDRVACGRGPEVGVDPAIPSRIKASAGRVQAGLHELGEGDPPILLDQLSNLVFNR